jgi:CelD/BcsL family acetyltransferase involved in cellulose biosynthesis
MSVVLQVHSAQFKNRHSFDLVLVEELVMFFAKLLPREDNFFEMFNLHADHMVDAVRAFSLLVANYSDVGAA